MYIYIYNLSFDEGIPQENVVNLKLGPHPVVKSTKSEKSRDVIIVMPCFSHLWSCERGITGDRWIPQEKASALVMNVPNSADVGVGDVLTFIAIIISSLSQSGAFTNMD